MTGHRFFYSMHLNIMASYMHGTKKKGAKKNLSGRGVSKNELYYE